MITNFWTVVYININRYKSSKRNCKSIQTKAALLNANKKNRTGFLLQSMKPICPLGYVGMVQYA